MENILSQLNADKLNIQLTSEKLYITTATSNETFALRSVNGVGVIDLVDEYNEALKLWKNKSGGPIGLLSSGCMMLIIALVVTGDDISVRLTVAVLSLAAIAGGYFLLQKNKSAKPNLMSAVRIMMSGGNRDFQFDKTGKGSENIAEFITQVESTLTSYHKNNG